MKSFRLLLATFAVSTLGLAAAHADTFSFTFGTTANQFNGSGTLTGNLISSGEYQITAVSGTTNTGNGVNRPIAGIQPGGVAGFESPDNLLFESSAGVFFFDDAGLSYGLNNGALVNVFEDPSRGPSEILERTNSNLVQEFAPYSVAKLTPEPNGLMLVGTGLTVAVGALRRRARL